MAPFLIALKEAIFLLFARQFAIAKNPIGWAQKNIPPPSKKLGCPDQA